MGKIQKLSKLVFVHKEFFGHIKNIWARESMPWTDHRQEKVCFGHEKIIFGPKKVFNGHKNYAMCKRTLIFGSIRYLLEDLDRRMNVMVMRNGESMNWTLECKKTRENILDKNEFVMNTRKYVLEIRK